MRREKFVPFGWPEGGEGGRERRMVAEAARNIHTQHSDDYKCM